AEFKLNNLRSILIVALRYRKLFYIKELVYIELKKVLEKLRLFYYLNIIRFI
ncbi:hypothetical protein CSPX01_00670, partial [Colletotrichum filicis]